MPPPCATGRTLSGRKPTHLFRRGAVYWVRFRLPRDLAAALECTEIRRSLGARELAVAKRRCLVATLWFNSALDTLRNMPSPTSDDLERAAEAFFIRLRADAALENFGQLDDREIDRRLRTSDERITELDRQLVTNDFDVWVKGGANALCMEGGFELSDADERQKLLALRLAARAERANLAGLVHDLTAPGLTYVPTDSLFASAAPLRRAEVVRPSKIISVRAAADLFERREQDRNVGTSHVTETARALRWLCEAVGGETPLAYVSDDQMRSFRDGISGMGRHRGKDLPFSNRGASSPEERVKSVTAKRYWRAVQAFWRWAVAERYVHNDPASGMEIDTRKGEERASPEPFSPEEVRRLAQTPLYGGYRSLTRVNETGDCHVRGAKWWSMVLLLHTGMRAGEAAQLLPGDFKFDDRVPHIKVRPTDDEGRVVKSVKTKASIRDVPIHADLLELGLREFVDIRATRYPNRRVFWDFRSGADGRKSDGMTKFWGAYLRKHGLWKPGRATHVGRHVVVARLRMAGVAEEDISAIVGHIGKTVTASYGGAFPLERKAETLAKLEFGFDLVGVLGGPWHKGVHSE